MDSEKDIWNMDLVLFEEVIKDCLCKMGKFLKVIIFVYFYGMFVKMDEIMEIVGCYGILVLEDVVEVLGVELNGWKCGIFGELVVFFFNGNKMIMIFGGGVLICCMEEEVW